MIDPQSTSSTPAPTPSAQRRLMRVVVPVVCIAFLLVWVAFVRYNDGVQAAAVQTSQQGETLTLSRIAQDTLTDVTQDARQLARSRNLRAFANQTLIDTTESPLNPYQQPLLNDFSALLNQHPCEYLAVRYITYTGSVWSEATNYDCNIPQVNPRVRVDEFSEDADVQAALRTAQMGDVSIGDIAVRRPQSGLPASRQRVITQLSSPVAVQNDDSNIVGVLQIEFAIDPLLAQLSQDADATATATAGRRVVIVDAQNQLLLDTGNDNFDVSQNLAFSIPTQLNSALPEVAEGLNDETAGDDGHYNRGDYSFSVANVQLPGNNTFLWRIVVIDDARLASLGDSGQIAVALLVAATAALGVSLLLNLLIGRTLQPLETASQMAQHLLSGDVSARTPFSEADARSSAPPAPPDARHPAAAIASGYQAIQNEMLRLRTDLSRESGRYARNLDTAARIGRETATLTDTDVLLNRSIDLICREYGFYHAQVFLLDDVGRNAVLVYSNGAAGQEMLKRQHKLVVGSPSVVGRVTATNKAVIINDTQKQGSTHRFNPLLPDTRAEMGLPLVVGTRVIGALDIQSLEPDVFRDDEVRVFQLLADQLAIALENARLAGETQTRLTEIDMLNRQLTGAAWEEATNLSALADVYRYDLMNVEQITFAEGDAGSDAASNAAAPLNDTALASQMPASQMPASQMSVSALSASEAEELGEEVNAHLIRIPITVRGTVIGALDAQSDADREFSQGDEAIMRAVADRVALAVERARLYEETQLGYTETNILYQLSRYLNEAANLDEIIQALIISVIPDATGGQIVMFDEYMATVGPNWSEIIAEWSLNDLSTPEAGGLRGTQFQLRAFPTLSQIASDQIHTVPNADVLEPELRELLAETGGKAFLFIPFSVRGTYRGMIFVSFPMLRQFSERDKHLYSALIDQAGVAIDNRMLLEQNAIALTRIERLYSSSRQINIAQSAFDLIGAAINSEEGKRYNYLLALAEGSGSDAGWSEQLRVAAYSKDQQVYEDTRVFPFLLAPDSPLRSRQPIVAADDTDSPLAAILNAYGYRFGAAFPLYSANQPIALFIIASDTAYDMDEDEFDIYRALTGQMSTVLQNRTLLEQTEQDRARLSSLLETLPAGVLVLDGRTLIPVQANDEMQTLLGRPIAMDVPFTSARYGLLRADTQEAYRDEDLPMAAIQQGSEDAFVDDVAFVDGEFIVNMLVNAAPIRDTQGGVSAIVAVFQNITPLRSMEITLQQNLANTTSLYETTRALIEAENSEDIIEQIVSRFGQQQDILEVQVALIDVEQGGTVVMRALSGYTGAYNLPDELLDAADVRIANLSEDTLLSATARQQLRTRGAAAYASIPLRTHTDAAVPLGWLVILYPSEQNFTYEREQYLITLADSAAIALDNRAMLRSTEQAFENTSSLYAATNSISAVRDIEGLGQALQSTFATLHPDIYAAYLLIENQGLVELFNENLDGAPVEFSRMIVEHDLLVAGGISIDDLRAVREPTPFIRDLLATGTLNAIQIMPLRAKGLPRGLIFIGHHLAHRSTPDETRYLNAIIDSSSVVADNIILFQEVQENLKETAALYDASRRMGDSNTSKDILDSIISNIKSHPLQLGFMVQLTTPGGWHAAKVRSEITASWEHEISGNDLKGIALSPEEFPGWQLLTTPEVIMIDDIEDPDTELTELERVSFSSFNVRSLAILPLRFGGVGGGAILFGSPEVYAHNERDLRVYTTLAEQASLRMEAARLLAQTERRARQLAASAKVAQVASSIMELDRLLPELVEVIRASFDYDHVQIFLMDSENDFAVLRASTGEAGRLMLANGHKLQRGSQSVIGQVTATGKPTLAEDTTSTTVVHRPNPYLPYTRSEMAIPLFAQGKVIGALDVQSNKSDAYDADDIATLTTMASQIAVALDNARLFNESRVRASEMSFLFSVTTTAASANTTSQALQNVAQELSEAMEAQSVSIYLPQQVAMPVKPGAPADYQVFDPDASLKLITLLRPIALAGIAGAAQPISELTEIRLDDPNNLIASIANTRHPLIITDMADEPRYEPISTDARSAIIVPLTSGAQIIGLIAMESPRPAAYDNNTLSLLLTLSGTLSAIVQNQNLLETLQNTNDQLRELDRLKSDFLANMSHELRTPLNSIIGFSRVILKGIDGPLTEMQEQDLSTIYNSGLHLLNLINDILDQAKIAAGKMDLQSDYFEIKNVIDGVRSIGIGLLKDKPVDMRVNLASGLPRAFGDEFRTRQVLLNLISNAAKFTRDGSIVIDAYPVVQDHHMMVRVDVSDTGIGISDQDMPALFEAFRQVDSSLTRVVGGTGLGLPIAKSLTEMQGGRMLVQSKVNVGSTFSILIPTEPGLAPVLNSEGDDDDTPTGSVEAPTATTNPRKQTGMLNPEFALAAQNAMNPQQKADDGSEAGHDAKEDTNIFARNARNAGGTPMTADSKRGTTDLNLMRPPMTAKRQVLLIEDNPDMVDQLRRGLGREGFDIFTASIPLEAEAMASALHPTLVVMDVNFSEGAGWNILKRLKAREDTVDIPIVVVSLSSEVEKIMAEGAFSFLRRPFTPEELVAAVREAEQESRIQRILIIDDQPESVRLLQQMLEANGQYRVFAANSGVEGISMVARRRPDLILLDLRMPDMDGFGVIEELRYNPETGHIPIVVVTGETLTGEEQAILSAHRVIYKTDLSADHSRPLIDGLRDHLSHGAGD